jgi:ATP-binding cassette subfamily C (CFTR/MRP) protein 1
MMIADVVQSRTLAMRGYSQNLTNLTSASLALKTLLLVVETWPKTKYLKSVETKYGPEHTMGIIGRSLYLWLNPLLRTGNRKQIKLEDCYALDHDLHAQRLQEQIEQEWNTS